MLYSNFIKFSFLFRCFFRRFYEPLTLYLRSFLEMPRIDTEIPQSWMDKIKKIMKEKGIKSKRQMLRNAIYDSYIKEEEKQG